MPIFDYKGDDARTLVTQAFDLMRYSYHGAFDGVNAAYDQHGITLTGLVPTLIGGLTGLLPPPLSSTPNAEQHARDVIEDKGWTVITREQLDYAAARVNQYGTFQGETLYEASAQADILGRYDANGHLTEIGIVFRGTTGPRETLVGDTLLDLVNDLTFLVDPNYHYAARAFGTLLSKVAEFAVANGLSGNDVLVTGHSLGGYAVNDLARLSQDAANPLHAFYGDANYIAQAAPALYDNPKVILNFGLENDPVFRATSDGLGGLLGVHDSPHASTTDNIVDFNDYYASPLFPVGVFSVLDLSDWLAHNPDFYAHAAERIASSAFYDHIDQDSVVVVADLSDPVRAGTWVEDKASPTATDHAGQPVFILGTDDADLLRSHGTSDFLEGRAGDDRFQLGGGQDIVLGGAGRDTVELSQSLASYDFAHTSDGTIYVADRAGDGSFSTLSSIEAVQTQEWVKFLGIPLYQQGITRDVATLSYDETKEGGAGDDLLQLAANGGGWAFGGSGNDILAGGTGDDHLDGGSGDDHLTGAGGSDVFVFSDAFGSDVIHDFGGNDRLDFVAVDGFHSADDVLAAAHQVGANVVIEHGADSITLIDVNLATLTHDDLLL